jgi:transcriptional regulator with XRE-family HTH domain
VPSRPEQVGSVTSSDCQYAREQLGLNRLEMGDFFRVSENTMARIELGMMKIPGYLVEVYEAIFRGLDRFQPPTQPPDLADHPQRYLLSQNVPTSLAQAYSPREVLWGPAPLHLGQRYLRIFSAAYGLGLDAEPGLCVAGTCNDPHPRGNLVRGRR